MDAFNLKVTPMKENSDKKINFLKKLDASALMVFEELCARMYMQKAFDKCQLHYTGVDNCDARVRLLDPLPTGRFNVATIKYQPRYRRFLIRIGSEDLTTKLIRKYPNDIVCKSAVRLGNHTYLPTSGDIDAIVDQIDVAFDLIKASMSYFAKQQAA